MSPLSVLLVTDTSFQVPTTLPLHCAFPVDEKTTARMTETRKAKPVLMLPPRNANKRTMKEITFECSALIKIKHGSRDGDWLEILWNNDPGLRRCGPNFICKKRVWRARNTCRIAFWICKIKRRFSGRQFGSIARIERCLPYVRKVQDLGSQPLQSDREASVRRHSEIKHS